MFPRHHQIGEALLQELLRRLLAHEHIALIGPRQGAKALVLEELEHRSRALPERQRPRIVRLIWDQFADCSENTFMEKFRLSLGEAYGVTLPPETPSTMRLSGRVHEAIEQTLDKARGGPNLWLFWQDIVGLSKPIARQVLEAVQAVHNEPLLRERMAVIVTGSSDFTYLAYGPNSPFRHASRFIVCTLEKEFALHYFRERRARNRGASEIGQEVEPDAFDYLYEQTGGNAHLIQELLVAVARHPFHSKILTMSSTWTREETERHLQQYRETYLPFDDFLRIALREVMADTESFDHLLALLETGKPLHLMTADTLSELPLLLDVNGFIKRDEMGRARLASPLLEAYLRTMLTPRDIADSFALQNRWDEAWRRYGQLTRVQRERPVSGVPRFRLRQVIQDWQASLLDQAYSGMDAVTRHFLNGMRCLLGFDEGGLYSPEKMHWILSDDANYPCQLSHSGEPQAPPEATPRTDVLCQLDTLRMRLWSTPNITSLLPERPRPAVQLLRQGEGREIDGADERVIRASLKQFWRAYQTAQDIAYRQRIGELREKHLAVIEAVNRELRTEPFDMGRLVQQAAKALVHHAGYYRILLCMVDARRHRIQGVAHYCLEPEHDFDYRTDYAIPEPDADTTDLDVQPWVVVKQREYVVPDVHNPHQRDPVINPEARRIGMKALAVVPMQVGNQVIGTVHFERRDGKPPAEDELRLVSILANQLAAIFHRSQRLTLLMGAVEALDDQVTILDPNGRVLLRNSKAALVAHQERGWQVEPLGYDWSQYKWAETPPKPNLLDLPSEAYPVHRYLTNRPEQTFQACDWQIARIEDFRGTLEGHLRADGTVGFIERIHDLTGIYAILEAFQHWLQAHDLRETASRIVQKFGEQGYAWCRLYLHHSGEASEGIFRSFEEHGFQDPTRHENFCQGGVQFRLEDAIVQPPQYALSVAREPAIYEFKKGSPPRRYQKAPFLDGFPRYFTGSRWNNPEIERMNVERWIEAPMYAGQRTVGILSLALPERLGSERWQLLKLWVQGAAVALDGAMQAEQVKQLHEEHIRTEELRKTVDFAERTFHSLRTPLSACRNYVSAHQNRERQAALAPEDSTRMIAKIGIQLERMEKYSAQYLRYVRGYSPVIRSADIIAPLRAVCEVAAETREGMDAHFHADEESLILVTDVDAIIESVDELIRNAYKAGGRKITVSVEDVTETDAVRILIADNGPGIPEAILSRLFEPDITKSRGGTGLGLAIVRETLQVLGGDIELDTTVSSGSRFILTLPKTNFSQKEKPA